MGHRRCAVPGHRRAGDLTPLPPANRRAGSHALPLDWARRWHGGHSGQVESQHPVHRQTATTTGLITENTTKKERKKKEEKKEETPKRMEEKRRSERGAETSGP